MRGTRECQLEAKKLVLNLTNAIRTPPCGAEPRTCYSPARVATCSVSRRVSEAAGLALRAEQVRDDARRAGAGVGDAL